MKINTNDKKKIQAQLDRIQNRARARCIQYDDVSDIIKKIEIRLSKMLYKKDWKGLKLKIDFHSQTFPGAYKGTPESTHIILEKGTIDWFLTFCQRRTCCAGYFIPLNLGAKKDQIVNFLENNF